MGQIEIERSTINHRDLTVWWLWPPKATKITTTTISVPRNIKFGTSLKLFNSIQFNKMKYFWTWTCAVSCFEQRTRCCKFYDHRLINTNLRRRGVRQNPPSRIASATSALPLLTIYSAWLWNFALRCRHNHAPVVRTTRICWSGELHYYYDDGVGKLMCREVSKCASVYISSCLLSSSSQMRAPNGMQMTARLGLKLCFGQGADYSKPWLCARAVWCERVTETKLHFANKMLF